MLRRIRNEYSGDFPYGLGEFEAEAEFEQMLAQAARTAALALPLAAQWRVGLPSGRPLTTTTATNPVLGTPNSALVNRAVPAHRCGLVHANGTFRRRNLSAITHIVIHSLVADYAGVIDRWRRGLNCHKPHYVIRNDGEITQIVDESLIAIHGNGANNFSVGIEHDGYYNDPKYLTEAMYVRSAALSRDICLRHSIPIDGTCIIGHDQARGTSHGDPGGYWDWEYYLALAGWDGAPQRRPIRIVLDCNSPDFSSPGGAWTAANRLPVQHGPHPKHSYGTRYFRAPSTTGTYVPAVFRPRISVSGDYEVSAWWPVSGQNISDAVISVFAGNAPTPLLSRQVNQASIKERSRTTIALPNTPKWFSLGTVPLRAGDPVRIEVSRRSNRRGFVIADAVRLLKR